MQLLTSLVVVLLTLNGCASPARSEAPPTQADSIMAAGPINSFDECVAHGYEVLRTAPPRCVTPDRLVFTKEDESKQFCVNKCGNGSCEEMVCMAIGCPCAETHASCPGDCPG